MRKVITYGTFDLLHKGHIRLLKRAKKLGDFLIVGVTSDAFDKGRGKINVKQSLSERIKGIEDTGLADQIIVEEYEGQKIDDIKRYNIDIFVVGSDWIGKFDYLKQYCQVVYLERTEGVSSTELRSSESKVSIGVVGSSRICQKFISETNFVNGASISGYFPDKQNNCVKLKEKSSSIREFGSYDDLLNQSDAVYIVSIPDKHYDLVKRALNKNKNVICESPICLSTNEWNELESLADKNNLVLMDSLKTAYSTAYSRLLLITKEKIIGDVVSVDATSTSLRTDSSEYLINNEWASICSWGPTVLLPVLQILGTDYKNVSFVTKLLDENKHFDLFTKISLNFEHATATAKSGIGIKSEGDLIVSGTKGYIYVPAPWWKTDYFEIRFENPSENKKVFYQLDGEGIRYEILSFVKSIVEHKSFSYISKNISKAFVEILEEYYKGDKVVII